MMRILSRIPPLISSTAHVRKGAIQLRVRLLATKIPSERFWRRTYTFSQLSTSTGLGLGAGLGIGVYFCRKKHEVPHENLLPETGTTSESLKEKNEGGSTEPKEPDGEGSETRTPLESNTQRPDKPVKEKPKTGTLPEGNTQIPGPSGGISPQTERPPERNSETASFGMVLLGLGLLGIFILGAILRRMQKDTQNAPQKIDEDIINQYEDKIFRLNLKDAAQQKLIKEILNEILTIPENPQVSRNMEETYENLFSFCQSVGISKDRILIFTQNYMIKLKRIEQGSGINSLVEHNYLRLRGRCLENDVLLQRQESTTSNPRTERGQEPAPSDQRAESESSSGSTEPDAELQRYLEPKSSSESTSLESMFNPLETESSTPTLELPSFYQPLPESVQNIIQSNSSDQLENIDFGRPNIQSDHRPNQNAIDIQSALRGVSQQQNAPNREEVRKIQD